MSTATDPSQPTVYEMIRTVSRQLDTQAQTTARIEGALATMVTQEQRRSDMELIAQRFNHVEGDQVASDARITWWARAGMTGLGFPIIVGAIMWITGASLSMPPT
jgi:hypothetical protein